MYRSGFNADFEKSQSLTQRSNGYWIYSGTASADLKTKITWPDGWAFGIAFLPTDKWTFSVDLSQQNWSKGKLNEYNYPRYRCTASTRICTPFTPGNYNNSNVSYPSLSLQNQSDTQAVRAAIEYLITAGKLGIPVRGGDSQE